MCEQKSSSFWSSALPVVTAIIAAAATYYFTAQQDRAKAVNDRKAEAYAGFVNSNDKDRMARELDCDPDKDKRCALRLQFELEGGAALRRIAIYGDKTVVHAIADYSRLTRPNRAPCAKTWREDVKMFSQMRADLVGAEQQVGADDLMELVLPPCRPDGP